MKRIVALAVAVGLVLAITSVASAETIGDAGRAAAAKQASLCGAPWNWVCNDATDPWPACHLTGVNQSGRAQWECLGGYSEVRITDNAHRICDTDIGVGPYGGIIYTNVYCH